MLSRRSRIDLILLAAVLGGCFTPWLTHPATSLRLTSYELSEWFTFLPSARDGSLTLTRLAFLMPLVCGVLVAALVLARQRGRALPNTLLSWVGLGGLALCVAFIFPPYEAYLFPDFWPDYQTQFYAGVVTLIGLVVLPFLPDDLTALLQTGLALVGAGYSVWAMLTLSPIATELLNSNWSLGWGWWLMLAGLVGLAWRGWARLFEAR